MLPSGMKVARFSLATTRSYKDSSGDWKEETTWHTVICWSHFADRAKKHLVKGSKVTVHGQLRSRKYRPANADYEVTVWETHANYLEPAVLVKGGSVPLPADSMPSEPSGNNSGVDSELPPTDDLPF